jgi:LuxR family maltose regulon positive regulatory protein
VASDSRRVYPDILLRGHIARARLQRANGDGAAALRTLAAFVELAEHRQLEPGVIARAHAARARITLEQGNLMAAIAWADSSGCSTAGAGSFLDEPTQLTYCRVRLAQGRHAASGRALHEAAQILDRLAEAAESGARGGSSIEIGMLRALVLAAQDQVSAALIVLTPALSRAAPEGYARLFLDEGAPMQALLRTAYERGIAQAYIETLLAAGTRGDDTGTSALPALPALPAPPQPLPEPLTSRELEVLHLLAAGRSTQTIAADLIVADGTAKRHIRNILGKLQAHSRLEAVARARDIGIIR